MKKPSAPLAAAFVHLVYATLDHMGDVFTWGGGSGADKRRIVFQAKAAILDDKSVKASEGALD